MDMRLYYRKIKEKEGELREESVVVVSLETPDGGKAGVLTEVSRRNGARLLVEGRAELASPEETEKFRQRVRDAKAAADETDLARKLEITFVPGGESKKGSFRSSKV